MRWMRGIPRTCVLGLSYGKFGAWLVMGIEGVLQRCSGGVSGFVRIGGLRGTGGDALGSPYRIGNGVFHICARGGLVWNTMLANMS